MCSHLSMGQEIFSSMTNYSLKNASCLASHKELNWWLEMFSKLLNVVYILIFINLCLPKAFYSSLCI